MWPETLGIFIPIIAIVGAFTVAIARTIAGARVRQLEIRERIAMIERGLVPPPETDPNGFERAMRRHDWAHGSQSRQRSRSAGIALVGVGLGLMVLIAMTADEPRIAVGVGGLIVFIGAAFLVNSLFEVGPPSRDYPRPPAGQPPLQGPPTS
jgi:hypothetical protein